MMRRVLLQDLQAGMIVARNIFSSDGRKLLNTGVILNEQYIRRIEDLGVHSVYIQDDLSDDIDIVDVVSEETRIEITKTVKANFELMEQKRKLNVKSVKNAVSTLLDELLANPNLMINLADIRTFDDYTFAHSVNVCILALMTGITLRYSNDKLMELGIGALLHDIGKTKIDKAILNKCAQLSPDEYAQIKRHSQYGFDILRQCPGIPLLSAHVAFQHHERIDGQGYPRRLKAEEIHEYAKITAVADVYDALLADRPYRSSYTINEALIILKHMSGLQLDQHCITALISNIAVYPIGSIVELNNEVIAIVVDVNKEMPTRPVVRVFYDKTQQRLYHPFHEIDLSKMSTILISRSLSENDISSFLNRKNVTSMDS